MMANSTSPWHGEMVGYLKLILKSRGLRYADLAVHLGVSEKTIKRYLNGRNLTLLQLESICAAAGLEVSDLVQLANTKDNIVPRRVTDIQEAVLSKDPRLAILLNLLADGWSVSRMLAEGLAAPEILEKLLLQLDQLGVITLYPKNRVRVRATLRPLEECSAKFKSLMTDAAQRALGSINFDDPQVAWRFRYARLSEESLASLSRRLDDLLEVLAELSRRDADLPPTRSNWYAFCCVASPNEVLGLKLLKEGMQGS